MYRVQVSSDLDWLTQSLLQRKAVEFIAAVVGSGVWQVVVEFWSYKRKQREATEFGVFLSK